MLETVPTAPALQARDLGTCISCGRSYTGRAARPRWAFARDGHLVGSVHTYHESIEGRRFPYLTAGGEQSVEEGRFDIWRTRIMGLPLHPQTEAEYDRQFAFLLVDKGLASDKLTDAQSERLDWWVHGSPKPLGSGRRETILAAYRGLLEEYRQWRTKVPPDETIPSREQAGV